MARWSLCPKHWSLLQLFSWAAFTMLAPLSVVRATCLSSPSLQESSASLKPCAIISPVWSFGKYDVCKQWLRNSQSSVMKCTVMLRYGSIVRLDHRSVVVEKWATVRSSASSLLRRSSYKLGIAIWLKYFRPGKTYLGSSALTIDLNPSLLTVCSGTMSLQRWIVIASVISCHCLLFFS